jgi:anti-sigma B factor antagonist
MVSADERDGAAKRFGLQRIVSESDHTLVLSGELDMTAAAALQAVIVSCVQSKPGGLTLDLRQLTFLDSTGLHLILFAQRLCQDKGAEFALIPGPRKVQHVFELAALVTRLPFRELTK